MLKGYAINQQMLAMEERIGRQLQDHTIQIHNLQEKVNFFDRSHDRFLCIDETIYHLGASIKDLGKKWFAFNRMEMPTTELLQKLPV